MLMIWIRPGILHMRHGAYAPSPGHMHIPQHGVVRPSEHKNIPPDTDPVTVTDTDTDTDTDIDTDPDPTLTLTQSRVCQAPRPHPLPWLG